MDSLSHDLQELRLKNDYSGIIRRVREAVKEDKRAAMSHWQVKAWCGLRWRNLFITEAVKDPAARKAASSKTPLKGDARSDRERIAQRFLRGSGYAEGTLEMPPADYIAPANTTFVFCPGLLNGLLPVRAFQQALPEFETELQCPTLRADLHPLRGCDHNARNIAESIESGMGLTAERKVIQPDDATPPRDVFLMGYSKGMADIVTLLVQHPHLAGRIRCIFGWAGAAGGSYVGDAAKKALDKVDEDPAKLEKIVAMLAPIADLPEIVERRLEETQIKEAVLHLTTQYRQKFLREHEEAINDLGIPIFNLFGSTNVLEVPSFQIQGLSIVNRYDSNNDMQVTQEQASLRMPMATDLAMLHGHHWDLSYDAFPKKLRMTSPHLDHPFPKKAALVANLKFACELGLID